MDNKFNTQNELYNRLMPALRCKKNELVRSGIKIVNEKAIWNYNKEHNWKKAKGLTLATMVDNILNTNNEIYEDYVVKKMVTE